MEQFLSQYFDVELMLDNLGPVLRGFWITIQLWAIASLLALIWGMVLALLRQLPGRAAAPVRWIAIAYIDGFRGVPALLVILLISGGLGALAAGGAIPTEIGRPGFFGKPDPFWYGVYALTLTYGAYIAEVYRAGIEAVPRGQAEAARSLGMSHGMAMRYVVVPQAIRKVIPPLLNDLIALMKDTSLVLVIGLNEVVNVGNDIQATTFNSSALTLGAICFLVVTIPLARVIDYLLAAQQSRFERGASTA